ncbi:unnamed protein product [Rotaria magnacalcarata]
MHYSFTIEGNIQDPFLYRYSSTNSTFDIINVLTQQLETPFIMYSISKIHFTIGKIIWFKSFVVVCRLVSRQGERRRKKVACILNCYYDILLGDHTVHLLPMHPVRGTVQSYAWGMIGSSSIVAQLASKSSSIVSTQPYAEYWMGTHPKSESYLIDNDQTSLKSYLNVDLPFLFKILSVETALSIQAHPNRDRAKILHEQNPQEYPDDNHKPEMAIALTKFECLCAFRPYKEINEFIQKYEQLQVLCNKNLSDQFSNAMNLNVDLSIQQSLLKQLYSNLMQSSPVVISQCVAAHLQLISSTTDSNVELSRLFERLNNQYPGGDVGLFSIYFFNYITLNPGEAILLKANIPHAYLHGQCIECMACSDNVVRAGLTPKFKDTATLIDMLDYQPLTIDQTKFPGEKISENIIQYDPRRISNIDDFIVQEIKGNNGVINAIDKPSLMVIIQGQGTMNEGKVPFDEASVYLIEKQTSINFKANTNILAYRAYSLI